MPRKLTINIAFPYAYVLEKGECSPLTKKLTRKEAIKKAENMAPPANVEVDAQEWKKYQIEKKLKETVYVFQNIKDIITASETQYRGCAIEYTADHSKLKLASSLSDEDLNLLRAYGNYDAADELDSLRQEIKSAPAGGPQSYESMKQKYLKGKISRQAFTDHLVKTMTPNTLAALYIDSLNEINYLI